MFILMQNQVYSRYVYQMLMQYGRVAIPSLGTFTLHPLTATFDNQRTKLFPPATRVSFDNQVFEDKFFVNHLIEAGMNAVDANLMQNNLVRDYATALSQNQNFILLGLGTFYPDGFVEETDGVFNRYQGLESINVTALPTYLKRNGDFVKVPDVPIISLSPKKESSANYLWPILLALLTLLIMLSWFFSRETKDAPYVVNEGSQTEIAHDSALNDDSLLTEIDSILAKNEGQINKIDTSVTTKEKSEGAKPEKTNGKVKPDSEIKSCIVIVGAFKNTKNADKLLKRINAKGYKTYTQMHNGLKRVGISYDCISKNPDLFKSNVQKQFNKDAWHLHDTI